ncbi:MAG TPA: phage integrase N-terminal SAM-like domain-containing protein, partial [Pyrinomonadaceae bacterium]|nr:phage integrase N-terminal SAM-like domain-containing protein [Pyrinomonadaceae bacterium]
MDTQERVGTALQARGQDLQAALRDAVSLWASATTAEGARRSDLLRDKRRVVLSFFDASKKLPSEVEPSDVQEWLRSLSEKGSSPNTVYQHACLLSSFYSWAMRDPEVGQYVRGNPARLARPRAPKPYQNESVKSLSDEEVQRLVEVVRRRAEAGDVVGKRDYALLLMYLATG